MLIYSCDVLLDVAVTDKIINICSFIYSFFSLLKVSQGDIGHAVGLLTTQTAEVQDPGEPQESGTSGEPWEGQKGTLGMQIDTKLIAEVTLPAQMQTELNG